MDQQITELLNRLKLSNMSSSLDKEPTPKADKESKGASTAEESKLGNLMEDMWPELSGNNIPNIRH